MGKDGRSAADLPLSLKVKNTFIDVNSSFVEDDADDVAFLQATLSRQRQVSEPVPCMHRQISGGPFYRSGAEVRAQVAGLPTDGLLEEEELEWDDLEEEEREEPETEKDPCWVLDRQIGRQETEPAWPMPSLGRQETEQYWPSWGLTASGATGPAGEQDPSSAAANMWLFQMPGVGGGQGGTSSLAMMCDSVAGLQDSCSGADPPRADCALPATSPAEHLSWATAGTYATVFTPNTSAASLPASTPQPSTHGTAGAPVPPPEWAGVSTVMMRNLPNKYTQHMLLDELSQSGFTGTFDFLYLPIDPETNANRGYAFINFTDPSFAWMLRMSYEGRKMSRFNSDKVVSVAPAALQGFEANYAHYSTSRVNRGDPAARPLFLRESSMRHAVPRHEGGRRRGGRRSSGSLIDMAARQQQHQQQAALAGGAAQTLGASPAHGAMVAANAAAVFAKDITSAYLGLNGGGPPYPDSIAATGAAKRTGAAEQLSTPRFCPYCGGKTQPQFRFCQFCGASLNLNL